MLVTYKNDCPIYFGTLKNISRPYAITCVCKMTLETLQEDTGRIVPARIVPADQPNIQIVKKLNGKIISACIKKDVLVNVVLIISRRGKPKRIRFADVYCVEAVLQENFMYYEDDYKLLHKFKYSYDTDELKTYLHNKLDIESMHFNKFKEVVEDLLKNKNLVEAIIDTIPIVKS